MEKENKLPEVGKRYKHPNSSIIAKIVYINKPCNQLVGEIEGGGLVILQLRNFLAYYEEIPEQEPTTENHIPNARKKVEEPAKDINVPTKSTSKWQTLEEYVREYEPHLEVITAYEVVEVASEYLQDITDRLDKLETKLYK